MQVNQSRSEIKMPMSSSSSRSSGREADESSRVGFERFSQTQPFSLLPAIYESSIV